MGSDGGHHFRIPISISWQYLAQIDVLYVLRKTDNSFIHFSGEAVETWFSALDETGVKFDDNDDKRRLFIKECLEQGILEYA